MSKIIRYFVKQSISVLGISVAYSAFLAFCMMNHGFDTLGIIRIFILGCAIMNLSYETALYRRDIPLTLSMGNTRRHIFIGTLFFALINMVLCYVTICVASFIFAPEYSSYALSLLPWIICTFAMTSAIGLLFGILSFYYGNKMTVILGVILGLILAVVVVFLSSVDITQENLFATVLSNIKWFAVAFTLCFLTVIEVIHHKLIYKFYV